MARYLHAVVLEHYNMDINVLGHSKHLIILADVLMPIVRNWASNNRPGWIMIGAGQMLPLCYVDQIYLSFSFTLCTLCEYVPRRNNHLRDFVNRFK